ncbi:hypothetical protein F5876DRAFT_84989 [Lentinula aff. lateritia]|uniref:Uncharacterized protein n=1 Tax=Lentinula aff. lateritia TaxID=2804960 RepID=A0ACC1TFT8_9AGAR|nr:hypothetical protein F5876DRAFT_84989 [Lentinula aff. lateritia]
MSPDVLLFTSRTYLSSAATSRNPSLLRDLDLGNVEAASYVELRTASPLQPPTLEDVHPRSQSPGTYPPGRISSQELRPSIPNSNTTYSILYRRSRTSQDLTGTSSRVIPLCLINY